MEEVVILLCVCVCFGEGGGVGREAVADVAAGGEGKVGRKWQKGAGG